MRLLHLKNVQQLIKTRPVDHSRNQIKGSKILCQRKVFKPFKRWKSKWKHSKNAQLQNNHRETRKLQVGKAISFSKFRSTLRVNNQQTNNQMPKTARKNFLRSLHDQQILTWTDQPQEKIKWSSLHAFLSQNERVCASKSLFKTKKSSQSS